MQNNVDQVKKKSKFLIFKGIKNSYNPHRAYKHNYIFECQDTNKFIKAF